MSKDVKDQKKKKRYNAGMSGARAMEVTDKAKDTKGSLKKLMRYMKPYRAKLILVAILLLLSTGLSILGPMMIGNATNTIVDGIKAKYAQTGSMDYAKITKILTTLTILYLITLVCNLFEGVLLSDMSQKVTYNLRKQIAAKINRLPLNYFDQESTGDILSRITNDAQTMSESLAQIIQQILSGVVMVVGILYMMLSISVKMTLMALIIVPLFGLSMSTLIKRSQKYFKTQQEMLGSVNGHIEEMYGAHLVMKAYSGEDQSINTFDTLNTSLKDSAWKAQFLSGCMFPMSKTITNIGYVCVAILGGKLCIEGVLTIGAIQAFFQYMRLFSQPITGIAQIANVLQATAAAAERVFEFLEEDEIKEETTNPVSIYDENGNNTIKGNVTFDHVTFGYDDDNIIIHDFSIDIKEGMNVAIVGPTGAGKTTLVKLLMRFYPIQEGTILVDGVDIKDYTRNDLRESFGMVLQDAWLQTGTIMDNIRYGNINACDEDVINAADAAYVDHFIRTLEDGYGTIINEESSNISYGQKQLLTIARAFLKDPKILILDEATSNVDTRTEILIQKGMANLMKDRTAFIIAHRLSTIKNADLILVLDHGDIVEAGKHDELLAKDGFYAKLYNAQFEENLA